MVQERGKKPEEEARENIDKMLDEAGWKVQSLEELNLGAGLGNGPQLRKPQAGSFRRAEGVAQDD